ncbi:DtxR family iron (metal) dependent repressor [Prosthecochloris sp. GSB1]|uniref:metal-dependent transcriptional regulator n=1 Tax=Prosthecochloris sp. GSB1 TaxID=281093 RepID=UPI000B8CAB14|nr:metal-dependent transcriptional regulator [Prosthecochloris sp. GSB1]ASQ91001.1 DtxR family iron (metal) dependent repressor [Prosthecochloris sp. GSB1]
MLSESSEMYLQTVFRLCEKNGEVSIGTIAEAMGRSLSTVSEKVKKLTKQGLLVHEWREGVSLSREGERVAGKIMRRRRLIETFLVEMAGYSPYEVHEDACRLEHVVSGRLTQELDRMLGYPQNDPHGHPIPSPEGELGGMTAVPLTVIEPGSRVRVAAISTADVEKMKYIDKLGFQPDGMCRLLDKAPFDGPLRIEIHGKELSIAVSLALYIQVERVS